MNHKTTNVAQMEDFSGEWMFSKQVAAHLGMEQKYFSERFIFETPDFPAPFRFTPAGRRRWLRKEINAWVSTKREAA